MPPRLAKALQGARRRIYVGPIRYVLRKTKLNELFSHHYWRLVYALSDNVQTHTIGNQTVSFRVSTFTEFKRFRDLAGEQAVIKDVIDSLRPKDTFYDIGANVGTYTCFTASISKQVVAFEPEPRNVSRLKENIGVNNLDASIVEIALSDTDGTVELALTGDEAGEGKHTISTGNDEQTIEVKTTKGDTIIDRHNLPAPTVLKIDVEGAELSVLRGLEQTLRESCRLVYVEVHPEKITDFGSEASEVSAFLTAVGFEVTKLTQRGSEVFLRASK